MNNWSAEKYLNGKFTNNLGSHCILTAKDGFLTGTYYTKPSKEKLEQEGFPIHGTYTPVKDGVLLCFNVTFKIVGTNDQDLERYSICSWNGKVYAKNDIFKMNWLLVSNQNADNEWYATNLGQDHFRKIE